MCENLHGFRTRQKKTNLNSLPKWSSLSKSASHVRPNEGRKGELCQVLAHAGLASNGVGSSH
jgi:hypothetical protein